MKVKLSIIDRDLGLKRIMENARQLARKPSVAIGVRGQSALAPKKTHDGAKGGKLNLVDVATIHEYGSASRNIPERSFIRATHDQNIAKYQALFEKFKDELFDGTGKMTVQKALQIVGELVKKDIQARIRAGISPPLKESTIRAKNHAAIAKAHATINGLEKRYNARAYQSALKGGKGRGFLTPKETERFNKASHTVLTGGKSTPLIDTGQLIGSISYKVDMEGTGGHQE